MCLLTRFFPGVVLGVESPPKSPAPVTPKFGGKMGDLEILISLELGVRGRLGLILLFLVVRASCPQKSYKLNAQQLSLVRGY